MYRLEQGPAGESLPLEKLVVYKSEDRSSIFSPISHMIVWIGRPSAQSHSCNDCFLAYDPVNSRVPSSVISIESPQMCGPKRDAMYFPTRVSQTFIVSSHPPVNRILGSR